MNIAVVGANGNLGSRVVRRALDAGLEVAAIVLPGASVEHVDGRAELVRGDLFSLSAEDLAGAEVLVSCFGSGPADPDLNERACIAYLELARATGVRVVAIMGSGCLFADAAHEQLVCEGPSYSKRLAPISLAAARGLARLDAAADVAWTVMTPQLTFDAAGPFTGAFSLDASREVRRNGGGQSYATYEDVAQAMVDEVLAPAHVHELVSVLSPC